MVEVQNHNSRTYQFQNLEAPAQVDPPAGTSCDPHKIVTVELRAEDSEVKRYIIYAGTAI